MFIHDNFLLENSFAQELYHTYAKKIPIIDYHNHLPSQEIAENKIFNSITEVWINGDHYKWRAMRTLGLLRAQQQIKKNFKSGHIPFLMPCEIHCTIGHIWN
jgi:glucuronate isomerase